MQTSNNSVRIRKSGRFISKSFRLFYTFSPYLCGVIQKSHREMLSLGITEASFVLLSLNRIIAVENKS